MRTEQIAPSTATSRRRLNENLQTIMKYSSVTLSWHGVWNRASAEELLDHGVLPVGAFYQFNKTTTVAIGRGFNRQGAGTAHGSG